jgi:anti-sigma B factor antagonist
MNAWAIDETFGGPATEEILRQPVEERTVAEGNLRVTLRRFPHVAVVKLCGSAEMGEIGSLRKLLGTVAEEHVQTLVLDLSDLSFIGSPGIAAIVCCHLRMRRYHGQIRIAGPQPEVLDVLERIRLTDLFGVYASVEQALAF